MTFEQALAIKTADIDLEYELRAARITKWVSKEKPELTNEQVEEIFQELVEMISNSDDEFDQLGLQIAEDIK